MKRTKWNDGWKFWKDKDSFALVWNISEKARDVTLPHDAMIEESADANSANGANTGFHSAECYTYAKIFSCPEEWEGKITRVCFEGVYMNALVYLNGQFVAKSPSGYSRFTADLTDFLCYGKQNELRVLAKAGAMPNSRWYSGAGIYRDVYLLQSEKCRIAENGVRLITEEAGEISTVRAEISIENGTQSAKCLSVCTAFSFDESEKIAGDESEFFLKAGEKRTIIQRIAIENARLWSENAPNLYTVTASLCESGKIIDSEETHFGIRSVSVDAKRGLRVNGECVKLRGACIHHDSGILGAATFADSEYRRIKILKSAGFNAVRSSHQPLSVSALNACDELGVFVMDELTDMWNRGKSSYDYSLFFQEWWKTDAKSMIDKDFNHPSVIIYSIGNEIPELGTNGGSSLAHEMTAFFRSQDSTRFTTAGINGVFIAGDAIGKIVSDIIGEKNDGENKGNVNDFMTVMDSKMDEIVVHEEVTKRLDKAASALDVAGYNYMRARYEKDAIERKNRVVVGTETYPPDIAKNWRDVKNLPSVIGDFTWTGWDYIGEAGVGIPAYKAGEGGFGAKFPAQLAYCGDIDITGRRRPMSYLREIVFGLRKSPYIAVQNPRHFGENIIKTPWVLSDCARCWGYADCEGKRAIIEVFSAGSEVELFAGGVSQGKKVAGERADYRVLFEIEASSLPLRAVSYENGKIIGEDTLFAAEKAASINICAERDYKSGELIFLRVCLLDSLGRIAWDDERELSISVSGGAVLQGFGSSDPKTRYDYPSPKTNTHLGESLAILRRTSSKEIRAEITCDSLAAAKITL